MNQKMIEKAKQVIREQIAKQGTKVTMELEDVGQNIEYFESAKRQMKFELEGISLTFVAKDVLKQARDHITEYINQATEETEIVRFPVLRKDRDIWSQVVNEDGIKQLAKDKKIKIELDYIDDNGKIVVTDYQTFMENKHLF